MHRIESVWNFSCSILVRPCKLVFIRKTFVVAATGKWIVYAVKAEPPINHADEERRLQTRENK